MMVYILKAEHSAQLAADVGVATFVAKELAAEIDGEYLGGHWEDPFGQRIETSKVGDYDVAFWRSAAGTLISAYEEKVRGV